MLAAGAALSTRDLAIDGRELMRELALPQGRVDGEILEKLVEVVTDDPAANERARLLDEARRIVAERAAS